MLILLEACDSTMWFTVWQRSQALHLRKDERSSLAISSKDQAKFRRRRKKKRKKNTDGLLFVFSLKLLVARQKEHADNAHIKLLGVHRKYEAERLYIPKVSKC